MIRKPLGRGLGALIETVEEAPPPERPSGLLTVPVDQIAPSPYQPRKLFDEERLQELARAIQSQGVIEPLVVRHLPADHGARYELIAGERRWRASQMAGLTAVPVVVRDLDDRSALEMSLVENLAREELTSIEEARAFVRLNQEFGLSHDQIAERVGKSRPHVSNTIRLLFLPTEVLDMLERGELTPGQARPLLSLENAEAQLEAALQIVESKLSARDAESLVSGKRKQAKASAAKPEIDPDPNLTALVEDLQRALKRKVRIILGKGKSPGKVEIDFYDDSDLTALAKTLATSGLSRIGAL